MSQRNSLWGEEAIIIDNGPPFNQSFNSNLIGHAVGYPNLSRSEDRVEIEIWVAKPVRVGSRKRLFLLPPLLKVRCLVDTGCNKCAFRGEVAKALGLKPSEGRFTESVVTFLGPEHFPSVTTEVAVLLGDRWLSIDACFPVLSPLEWRVGLLIENCLGMRGILSERMLCFTPERLFVFPRK